MCGFSVTLSEVAGWQAARGNWGGEGIPTSCTNNIVVQELEDVALPPNGSVEDVGCIRRPHRAVVREQAPGTEGMLSRRTVVMMW